MGEIYLFWRLPGVNVVPSPLPLPRLNVSSEAFCHAHLGVQCIKLSFFSFMAMIYFKLSGFFFILLPWYFLINFEKNCSLGDRGTYARLSCFVCDKLRQRWNNVIVEFLYKRFPKGKLHFLSVSAFRENNFSSSISSLSKYSAPGTARGST